jgi:hypothetical protein
LLSLPRRQFQERQCGECAFELQFRLGARFCRNRLAREIQIDDQQFEVLNDLPLLGGMGLVLRCLPVLFCLMGLPLPTDLLPNLFARPAVSGEGVGGRAVRRGSMCCDAGRGRREGTAGPKSRRRSSSSVVARGARGEDDGVLGVRW